MPSMHSMEFALCNSWSSSSLSLSKASSCSLSLTSIGDFGCEVASLEGSNGMEVSLDWTMACKSMWHMITKANEHDRVSTLKKKLMARITTIQLEFREFQTSKDDILKLHLVAHIKQGYNCPSMAITNSLGMKLSILIEPHMWFTTQNISMHHQIWHKHWWQQLQCPSQINEESSSIQGSDCLAQKTSHKTSTLQKLSPMP